MKQKIFVIICLVTAGFRGFCTDLINDNIVKIYVTANTPDFSTPWQMKGIENYEGSGCIIGDNLILTNAHVISNNTFITVKRSGQTKKYIANVQFVAHDCDLAVLKVEDKVFFPDTPPLQIGELSKIGDEVSVYGYPSGAEQVTLTKGIVSRISYENYIHSSAYLLSTQIDASINAGSSGGPVINNNKIVGISMMAGWGENEGFLIPVPVIDHFLKDISDCEYNGFPDLGITLQRTENPSLQAFYGLSENITGVLVREIFYRSPVRNILYPGDIILSIENFDIANDGSVVFRDRERVSFLYAVHHKQINEEIKLKILRNHKIENITVPLSMASNQHKISPEMIYDKKPRYFIYGGIIFTTLNKSYLHEYGESWSWYDYAPTNFLYHQWYPDSGNTKKEIVVILDVLSDDVNLGYEGMYDEIVMKVNGKEVSSLQFLIEEIENNNLDYQIFETDCKNVIILESQKADARMNEILDIYDIESDRSEHFF